MKILIAGGTGFVGQKLVPHFLIKEDEVTVLGRNSHKIKQLFGDQVKRLTWEILTSEELAQHDLIINLSGANIGDKRWSEQRKKIILSSRINTTNQLATLCAHLQDKSPPLLNASAVGIYGLQKTVEDSLPPALDESTQLTCEHPADFLSETGCQWEAASQPAVDAGVRVVNLRFGVVMSREGGVFKKIAMPFYFGLGGPIGSGEQPFSWVCLTDLIRAIDFLIDHETIKGPVNIVSPHCLKQKELAKKIGEVLNKPSFMPTPSFVLKLIFGQMAEELLLNGQHVKPTKLTQAGFTFKCSDLKTCLRS